MKYLIAILFLSSAIYSQAFRLSKTDSDSLWQGLKEFDRDIAKEEFTVRYDKSDGIVMYGKTAFPLENLPKDLQIIFLARIKPEDWTH